MKSPLTPSRDVRNFRPSVASVETGLMAQDRFRTFSPLSPQKCGQPHQPGFLPERTFFPSTPTAGLKPGSGVKAPGCSQKRAGEGSTRPGKRGGPDGPPCPAKDSQVRLCRPGRKIAWRASNGAGLLNGKACPIATIHATATCPNRTSRSTERSLTLQQVDSALARNPSNLRSEKKDKRP